jgi:hypothetical protein
LDYGSSRDPQREHLCGDALCALREAKDLSEFLLIFVPHDESGLDVQVREFDTAEALDEALLTEKAAAWRDLIGIYRHEGRGPLDGKWWGGPSTINRRRWEARGSGEAIAAPLPGMN